MDLEMGLAIQTEPIWFFNQIIRGLLVGGPSYLKEDDYIIIEVSQSTTFISKQTPIMG